MVFVISAPGRLSIHHHAMHGNEEYGNSSHVFQVEWGHSHALPATNRLFFCRTGFLVSSFSMRLPMTEYCPVIQPDEYEIF